MSIDGYIDDATDERLLLSNDVDFDRVDEVRAGCDAILVGANTIRRDNPRLLVRSPDRRAACAGGGGPAKVTLTAHGDLDPAAAFFATGDVQKIVYCGSAAAEKTRLRLAGAATVVDAGDPVDLAGVLSDLARRGIGRLLVEGGSGVHTRFLTAGLADELHLVVAPFFVGDGRAPRFVTEGTFPWTSHNRARLVRVEQIGDVVLLRYALSDRYGTP
jgi:5-amino-6-(5-phosphoribosylamino)uracil reductase